MSPVKDFSNDVIKQRVEARQKARREARKEAKSVVDILRFPDGKLFIDADEEEVRPIQLMLGLTAQHIEMLEATIMELVKENERLTLELQQLRATGIERAKGPLPLQPGG